MLAIEEPRGVERNHPGGEDLEAEDDKMQMVFRKRQNRHLEEALNKAKEKDNGFVDLTLEKD